MSLLVQCLITVARTFDGSRFQNSFARCALGTMQATMKPCLAVAESCLQNQDSSYFARAAVSLPALWSFCASSASCLASHWVREIAAHGVRRVAISMTRDTCVPRSFARISLYAAQSGATARSSRWASSLADRFSASSYLALSFGSSADSAQICSSSLRARRRVLIAQRRVEGRDLRQHLALFGGAGLERLGALGRGRRQLVGALLELGPLAVH